MEKAFTTICVASSKGGVGKSSISVHLTAASGMKTALINTDHQRSCEAWYEQRKPANVVFFGYDDYMNYGLDKLLKKAQDEGCQFVIFDTPPHSHPSTVETFKRVDVFVIPTDASFFDIRALPATLQMVYATDKPIVMVLNRCKPNEKETKDAIKALEALELPLVTVKYRVAYKRAVASGLTVAEYRKDKEAIEEMQKLWTTIQKELA